MVAFGNNQFADLHRILGTHRSATLKFSSGIHCLQDLYQAAYSCCCSDNCILSSIMHSNAYFSLFSSLFAGWFEAYLGGRWYTFDARNNMPRSGRVLIAQGRDAADVPITHTFGPNTLVSFKVWTDEVT